MVLRLKDIAKVVLGSEYYDIYSNMNGHPSAAMVIKQTYGSNASAVIENQVTLATTSRSPVVRDQ